MKQCRKCMKRCPSSLWWAAGQTFLSDLRAGRGPSFHHILPLGVLGELEENLFQGAVGVGLSAEGVEAAAADQPAMLDDADPVGELLDDIERVRGEENGHAGIRLAAQQVLEQ